MLRTHHDDDPRWSEEDDQEKTQEDGQEEERGKEAGIPEEVPAGTTGSARLVLPPRRQTLLDPMAP